LFLTQFLATRKRKKDTTCLLTMRQGKKESLKDFMLRFNKEKLEVDTPDDKTMLFALMQGVRAEGPLMAEVGRKNIQKVTLPQFMKLTEEFIHHEELVGTLLKAQTLEEQAKQKGKKASTNPKQEEDIIHIPNVDLAKKMEAEEGREHIRSLAHPSISDQASEWTTSEEVSN
jgi:hypothetical protein